MQVFSYKFLGQISSLFLCAFFIRAVIFYGFVQHDQRYRQADSMDYHICALSIKHWREMINPSTKEPIFWRTPGYPYFLSWFYDHQTGKTPQFEHCNRVHSSAIFWQIILCSLLSFLVFILAWIITQSLAIAWLASGISAFHIGHVLASCYLLTDALASLFFILFLICFFSYFKTEKYSVLLILGAAFSLALYTWMRPNGIFMAIAFAPLLLLKIGPSYTGKTIKKILLNLTLFLGIFFASLAPWYIRNYQLTGYYFFCPMMGPYLQAFLAPRIMRDVTSQPLEKCIKTLSARTYHEHQDQKAIAKTLGLKKIIPQEFVCLRTALPWVQNYPLYCIQYWSKEIIKTAFDLYSYQLVAMHEKNHTYDQAEEFLFEKLHACLFKPSTPLWIKIIAWLELIFSVFMWIGFIASLCQFFLFLFLKSEVNFQFLANLYFIGVIIGMTGGFGYARLRLCAEPLIIITSLMFWYILYRKLKRETFLWINYTRPGAASMQKS